MLHTIKALKDEKIVAIIQSLHDVMLPLYQNYCDNAGYMNFEMIFNFYKDFEIFPEIVNLIQLKNIFFVLSESMCSNSKEQEKSENGQGKRNLLKNEYINYPLFLESIAFSAMFFRFEESFNNIDKLLYMIERMNHSKGIDKAQDRME